MIDKLIELKLIKKQLIVLTAADLNLKSADADLFSSFSAITWNQIIDLVNRALQLLDVKITDKTTDEEINQIINVLLDSELAYCILTDVNISSVDVIVQLKTDLDCLIKAYRDNY